MPPRLLPCLLAIATIPLASAPMHVARAQDAGLQRCMGADGVAIYTDRPCDTQGAGVRDAPRAWNAPVRRRPPCALSAEDLLWGVRSALEAQDVNRLAAYYHWTGISNTEAGYLMNRLMQISDRPLVDARLVFVEREIPVTALPPLAAPRALPAAEDPLAEPSADAAPAAAASEWPPGFDFGEPGAAPAVPPAATPGTPTLVQVPVALQIDQVAAADSAHPVAVTFQVQRYFNCWWIRF
jgi:hypothetical protein